jgi:hypothetical protein
MPVTEIKNPISGIVGYFHEIEYDKDSLLVFQLPRATNMLSETYVQGALRSLREILPDGKKAIVIGADVNIYEIAGQDATVLVLKGII